MKKMKTKTLAMLTCVMVLLVGAAGATLAWLTDETGPVTNTFTTSDINVDLTETTGDEYQMIPGFTIDMDPLVTVEAGSEDCWVFIKVVETGKAVAEDGTEYSFDDYLEYTIDNNNWIKLEDGVYYCKATDITADRNIKVLLNNQVTVKGTVTKEMMDALEKDGAGLPNLTFTAYAHQLYETNGVEFDPAKAWENINK